MGLEPLSHCILSAVGAFVLEPCSLILRCLSQCAKSHRLHRGQQGLWAYSNFDLYMQLLMFAIDLVVRAVVLDLGDLWESVHFLAACLRCYRVRAFLIVYVSANKGLL